MRRGAFCLFQYNVSFEDLTDSQKGRNAPRRILSISIYFIDVKINNRMFSRNAPRRILSISIEFRALDLEDRVISRNAPRRILSISIQHFYLMINAQKVSVVMRRGAFCLFQFSCPRHP